MLSETESTTTEIFYWDPIDLRNRVTEEKKCIQLAD